MFMLLLFLSLSHAVGLLAVEGMEACEPLLRCVDSFLWHKDESGEGSRKLTYPNATFLWDKNKNTEFRVDPLHLHKVLQGESCPDDSFLSVFKDCDAQNSHKIFHCVQYLESWMAERQKYFPGAIVEENYLAFSEENESALIVTSIRVMSFPKKVDERSALENNTLKRVLPCASDMMKKRTHFYEIYVAAKLCGTNLLSPCAAQSEDVRHCCFMREDEIEKCVRIYNAKRSVRDNKKCSIL
ncbi:MAG: hypothetical protein OXC30_02020 [Alphaproteobacteria bacterium]|nr:hypothetical protein [Alphaproteobacteria bacterium]